MIYVLRVYIGFLYTFKIFSNFFKASAWYKMLYNTTNCAPLYLLPFGFSPIAFSMTHLFLCSKCVKRRKSVWQKLKNDLLISAEFWKRGFQLLTENNVPPKKPTHMLQPTLRLSSAISKTAIYLSHSKWAFNGQH